ncbi:MAG: 6-carboxytetrahydropterin synthase [Calditrichaeota bacterium]|nr:MAG: 6-carboxytetrahydropterin synthase [Calditrichota bacterium]
MDIKKTVKIGDTFYWEMGHRLPYHSGGCENIHGHSYRLVVEVEGTTDRRGMVMDYYELRAIVQPILSEIDHCFMCSTDDQLMMAFLKDSPFKVVYVDFPTTAENIARYLLTRIAEKLKTHQGIEALTVRVSETHRDFAECRCEFR